MESSVDLNDIHKWCLRVANSMWRGVKQNGCEDLAQEGLIAAWKAINAYDPTRSDDMLAFVKMKARNRMKDIVVKQEPFTTAVKGTVHIPRLPAPHEVEFGEVKTVTGGETTSFIDTVPDSHTEREFDRVDASLYADEIRAALDEVLTETQVTYVLMKFYEEKTYTEITEHFGYSAGPLWHAKGRNEGWCAKARLAKRLSHLKDIV